MGEYDKNNDSCVLFLGTRVPLNPFGFRLRPPFLLVLLEGPGSELPLLSPPPKSPLQTSTFSEVTCTLLDYD